MKILVGKYGKNLKNFNVWVLELLVESDLTLYAQILNKLAVQTLPYQQMMSCQHQSPGNI